MTYTNQTAIEAMLARSLTAAEAAQLVNILPAVDEYVEGRTGRSWTGNPVTNEQHRVVNRIVRLNQHPVAAITSITARLDLVGALARTLVAGVDYELLDAALGKLLLTGMPWGIAPGTPGMIVTVSYTVSISVPTSVKLASSMLAIHWLAPTTDAKSAAYQASGIKSYSVGQELSVTFIDQKTGRTIPTDVDDLLLRFQPKLAFA